MLSIFLKKWNFQFSGEVDILIKTHICKLRGIISRSRVLRTVYTLVKDTGR